jgi:hypothetical protein
VQDTKRVMRDIWGLWLCQNKANCNCQVPGLPAIRVVETPNLASLRRDYGLGLPCKTKPIDRSGLDGSRSLWYADNCQQATSVELWDLRAWCGCSMRSRALRQSGRFDSARCCLRIVELIPAFLGCSLVPGRLLGPARRDSRSACPFADPAYRSVPARRLAAVPITWGKLPVSLIPGPYQSDI